MLDHIIFSSFSSFYFETAKLICQDVPLMSLVSEPSISLVANRETTIHTLLWLVMKPLPAMLSDEKRSQSLLSADSRFVPSQ